MCVCEEEASVLSQYFNISLQVQYISVHSREHKTPLKNQTSVLECRVMFYVTPVCMCKEKKLLALSKIILYICYTRGGSLHIFNRPHVRSLRVSVMEG